jgi:LDH2 family malate/lactate/ureidoglycolate dehydrogenase
MYENFERPQNIGHLFGVLPVAGFEAIEIYTRRTDKAIRELRDTARAPGVERIYLPSEREALLREARRRSGIPIQESVWKELRELGSELGLVLER